MVLPFSYAAVISINEELNIKVFIATIINYLKK